MELKPIAWIKASRRTIKDFPDEARWQAGAELLLLQEGKQPTDWKPMSSVGPGASEIRIHQPHEHRIIYVAKFAEAIYVLHCFAKKTKKTPNIEIQNARTAYAEMQRQRKEKLRP